MSSPATNEARATTGSSHTPKTVGLRIKKVFEELQAFVGNRGNDRLRGLWPEWKTRLHDLFDRVRERPEVAISLVGGTGAGKSTLLNALVGVRVLPVSNMRACTSAICEVSYADGPYTAHVEFVARSSWKREVDLLLGDLRDIRDASNEDSDSDDTANQLSRLVRDKLWTVYRSSDETPRQDFDPLNLIEPSEITEALDAGSVEIEHTSVEDFRKDVAQYLDSKHRFWPIVKSVAIRGPFAPLRDGAKIIDLPGLNDPNEAREEATKLHLKTCRFVWLVFNIKRALTKDAINLMQSDDFLRQVVMDGRADSLTFIGTASDDLDHETAVEEFGLHSDAPLSEAVAARNREVRKIVLAQLEDLVGALGNRAREHKGTAQTLTKRLAASKVFTVSAREYLRLQGLAKTNPSGLDDPSQTELPALTKHMRHVCSAYGVAAHCQSINRQLDLFLDEVKREIQTQRTAHQSRAEISERGRKEMRAAVDAARDFLTRDLEDAQERLVQDLEAAHALLAERVKRAVDRGRADLEQTLGRWERTHHLTIRAVCRRGGTFVGRQRNDFPADLSKPILDGIAFAWSDFFGERLRQHMEKATDRLLGHASGYQDRLTKALSTLGNQSSDLITNIAAIFDTSEKVLRELLSQTNQQIEAKIEQSQRTLYESVPDQIRANMQAAFAQAAEQVGTGMKRRMLDVLIGHARRIADVMFNDARESLLNGVRGLNDWLAREHGNMVSAVQRNGTLAAENVTGVENLSGSELVSEQKTWEELTLLIGPLYGTVESDPCTVPA
jgi:energy-coupling factor transporter ATP-binding protein EcfA2/F0F1-type ATP synthase membrane subunit b/b'